MKRILFILPCLLLCSCIGFNNALSDQKNYNANLRIPAQPSAIKVEKPLDLRITVGAIPTVMQARLSAGRYRAVAESDVGIFYLAPFGGFSSSHGSEVKSEIGGLVKSKAENRYHVWYCKVLNSKENWEAVAAGHWTADAKAARWSREIHWIERRFEVPSDGLKEE